MSSTTWLKIVFVHIYRQLYSPFYASGRPIYQLKLNILIGLPTQKTVACSVYTMCKTDIY